MRCCLVMLVFGLILSRRGTHRAPVGTTPDSCWFHLRARLVHDLDTALFDVVQQSVRVGNENLVHLALARV